MLIAFDDIICFLSLYCLQSNDADNKSLSDAYGEMPELFADLPLMDGSFSTSAGGSTQGDGGHVNIKMEATSDNEEDEKSPSKKKVNAVSF